MRNTAASGFRIDLKAWAHHPGARRHLERQAVVGEGWGIDLIGLPAGQPIDLSLDLTAVGEGVLVVGQARFRRVGQCARCLTELDQAAVVDFQELFVYPHQRGEADDDLPQIEAESLDLEPVVHDSVVLDLPLAPLCEDNCAGLCVECGANLNADPVHSHHQVTDERWAQLAQWVSAKSQSGPDDRPKSKE
ncbi:MAG: DUF177 domain-containing protein [Propionibacteriaceae bacterium]|jgi:uncharacterized protein|nr:DUF177 domain-containing protein [Propionibacteriaceae bacterium]